MILWFYFMGVVSLNLQILLVNIALMIINSAGPDWMLHSASALFVNISFYGTKSRKF